MSPVRYNLFLIVSSVLFLVSCDQGGKKEAVPSDQSGPAITQGALTGSAAGVTWTVPGRWTAGSERQMRVATYMVPAHTGDSEQGECAVFYFGPSEGGDVESNIERWVSQFESSEETDRWKREVDGITVHLMSLSGTYLASGGPMMASGPKKEGYRILGAIAEAPQGSVFFKMTGPEETIKQAEGEFEQLVNSLIGM